MYTLRRISGNGIEMNHCLGGSYTVVRKRGNKPDFLKTFKTIFDKEYDKSNEDDVIVYAFVSDENGEVIYPLYKSQRSYIMCSDGKTLDNLTW